MLSDSLDVERRSGKWGPFFTFTRYTFTDQLRHVNVSYAYLEKMARLRYEIQDCIDKKLEKQIEMENCKHGLAIREFMEQYYVFIPFIIEPPSTVDFSKSLNLQISD